MTLQDMLILYIGDNQQGEDIRAAAELDGGYVYLPDHMTQALGMYITYLPNVIIVDSGVSYSAEVVIHLRSVDARPILLLIDDLQPAQPRIDGVYALSRYTPADEILEAARHLASGHSPMQTSIFSNGYRRTG